MKKEYKVILCIYIALGISLVIIGLKSDVDYYSTMIFAMGFGLIMSSIVQFVRLWRNTRPENI